MTRSGKKEEIKSKGRKKKEMKKKKREIDYETELNYLYM